MSKQDLKTPVPDDVASAIQDNTAGDKFEEWAISNNYNMTQHPLHYLFLNPRTDGARQGWKAAINWLESYIRAASTPRGEGS